MKKQNQKLTIANQAEYLRHSIMHINNIRIAGGLNRFCDELLKVEICNLENILCNLYDMNDALSKF